MNVFKFKDPVSGRQMELPVELGDDDNKINLQELLGHVISKSRTDVENKFKELTNKKNEESASLAEELKQQTEATKLLSEKIAEMESANLSEKEKNDLAIKAEIEKYKTLSIENEKLAKTNFNMFCNNKIDSDINRALSSYDLCNRDQTISMLKSIGKPELVENNGKYDTTMTIFLNENDVSTEVTLPTSEAIKKFLDQEENSYLLKNNLKSGDGSGKSGGLSEDNIFSKEDFNKSDIRQKMLEQLKDGKEVQIK